MKKVVRFLFVAFVSFSFFAPAETMNYRERPEISKKIKRKKNKLQRINRTPNVKAETSFLKKDNMKQKETVSIDPNDAWKYEMIPDTHQGEILDPISITPEMLVQASEQVKVANNSVINKLAKKRKKKKSNSILASKKSRRLKKKRIKKPHKNKSIYLRQELERYRNMYV